MGREARRLGQAIWGLWHTCPDLRNAGNLRRVVWPVFGLSGLVSAGGCGDAWGGGGDGVLGVLWYGAGSAGPGGVGGDRLGHGAGVDPAVAFGDEGGEDLGFDGGQGGVHVVAGGGQGAAGGVQGGGEGDPVRVQAGAGGGAGDDGADGLVGDQVGP